MGIFIITYKQKDDQVIPNIYVNYNINLSWKNTFKAEYA